MALNTEGPGPHCHGQGAEMLLGAPGVFLPSPATACPLGVGAVKEAESRDKPQWPVVRPGPL